MIFAVVLAGLGLASEIARSFLDRKQAPAEESETSFDSYFADLRKSQADASTPEKFIRGTLAELSQNTLTLNLPSGTCKRYLAATQPPNEIEVSWWSNGPGARNVKVDTSGSENFKTGTICTDEKFGSDAELGLIVKMVKGSGKYAVETYFLSQRIDANTALKSSD